MVLLLQQMPATLGREEKVLITQLPPQRCDPWKICLLVTQLVSTSLASLPGFASATIADRKRNRR